jgi:hypothetical protein
MQGSRTSRQACLLANSSIIFCVQLDSLSPVIKGFVEDPFVLIT